MLNQSQRIVAQLQEGSFLLIAGAGSGKTRTLVERVKFLLNKGVPSSEILLISFTNKACEEMSERLKNRLTAKTFHSLSLEFLKEGLPEDVRQKNFTLYDKSDQLSLVRTFLRSLKIEKKPTEESLLTALSFKKNNQTQSRVDYFDDFFSFYENSLKFFNALDFDDLLVYAEKYITDEFIKKFQYIMVDEFQDTNHIQMSLIRKLTKFHKNLMAVGDMDQSIYGFRGARQENLKEFLSLFQPKTYFLSENYRSNKSIITFANQVISSNERIFPSAMIPIKSEEGSVELFKVLNEEQEAEFVVEIVKKYKSNVAIFFRSSTQIPFIEEAFLRESISYKLTGGKKIFEKKEIKDLIAYISFIQNPYDSISLRRIINTPARGFGEKSLQRALDRSSLYKIPLYKTLEIIHPEFFNFFLKMKKIFSEKSLVESFAVLLEEIQWNEYLHKTYGSNPKMHHRKLQDLFFLKKSMEFFKGDVVEYLRNLKLEPNEKTREEEPVQLMSIHSSKGLEFDYVILLGVEEDILPHKKSYLKEHFEEERRLFYVASTRAKKKLFMTQCIEKSFQGKKIYPIRTRFLKDLDDYFVVRNYSIFSSKEEQEHATQNYLQDLINSI